MFESVDGGTLSMTMAHACRKKWRMKNKGKNKSRGHFTHAGSTTHRQNRGSRSSHGDMGHGLTDTHTDISVYACVSVCVDYRRVPHSSTEQKVLVLYTDSLKKR